MKATGEPLAVDFSSEQHAFVGQQRVGEVVQTDGYGRVVGTSEVYEDRLYQYNVTHWQVFQGNTRIDDEDFFRIAGDRQAADQIAAMRQRAVTVNRVGFIILGVGVAALAAGLALSATLPEQRDEFGSLSAPTWPTFIVGSGVISALVGGGMAWYGAAAVKRQHPIDDARRAKRTGDRYNFLINGPEAPAEPPKAQDKEPEKEPKQEPERPSPTDSEDTDI